MSDLLPPTPYYDKLSLQQRQIVDRSVLGQSINNIAKTLNISVSTVKRALDDVHVKTAINELTQSSLAKSKKHISQALDIANKSAKIVMKELIKIATGEAEKTPRATQLAAIDSVLDRVGMPRQTSKDITNKTEITAKMGKSERDERFAAVVTMLKRSGDD